MTKAQIAEMKWLADDPQWLEQAARCYGITVDHVRQICMGFIERAKRQEAERRG
jgi:hypothetical protein